MSYEHTIDGIIHVDVSIEIITCNHITWGPFLFYFIFVQIYIFVTQAENEMHFTTLKTDSSGNINSGAASTEDNIVRLKKIMDEVGVRPGRVGGGYSDDKRY